MDASQLAGETAKISEETSQRETQRLFDFYDVVVDDMTPGVDQAFAKIKRAIASGRVELFETEDGLCVRQKLTKPTRKIHTIEYGVVSGKTKLATKNVGTDDPFTMMYAILASLGGLNPADFLEVKAPDIGLCESLALVFLKG